jgi:DNA invertase Pin-like site-specific DNA recombinase
LLTCLDERHTIRFCESRLEKEIAVSTYDIYTRVSNKGGRDGDSYGSPEDQEAAARSCALRLGLDVGEVVLEENVSGVLAADDREVGRLLRRCERGKSAGIIFPRLDRLTRDVFVGGQILARMQEAEARLISADGAFDSENLTPESEMVFNMLNTVGQHQRKRNRAFRLAASKRASRRGVYLAKKPPLGYMRAQDDSNYVPDPTRDGRRIVPDPDVAPLIHEVFLRRARGETSPALAAFLNEHGAEVTPSGVRHLLLNRAYVGEATCQSERKGEPDVIKSAHDPIVTEAEFAAARAKGGPYHPRNGSLANQVRLGGLVVCGSCGRRLQVGGHGKRGARKAHYFCTAPKGKCPCRASITAKPLDDYLQDLILRALLEGERHVMAVNEDDDRYRKAIGAVEAARRDLEEYRDDLTLQRELGTKSWAEGLKPRKEALRLAQEQLAITPPPGQDVKVKREALRLAASAEAHNASERALLTDTYIRLMREANRRFIDRVVVKPIGRGRRHVAERVDVYLVGADKSYRPSARTFTKKDLDKFARLVESTRAAASP